MYNFEAFIRELNKLHNILCLLCVVDNVDDLIKSRKLADEQLDKLYRMKRVKLFGLDEEE